MHLFLPFASDGTCVDEEAHMPRLLSSQVLECFGIANTGYNWLRPGLGGATIDARTYQWRWEGGVRALVMRKKYTTKNTAQMRAFVDSFHSVSATHRGMGEKQKHMRPDRAAARTFCLAVLGIMGGDVRNITATVDMVHSAV